MENDYQHPYRATRLWNEVILAFRTGMPLRRHRHRIRHYNNCFTASDCISWLNCYLKNNPNFGPHVTRQQTIQLLQKFLKSNVIESATCKNRKSELRDDAHLYRFVEYSPPKSAKKSPLQSLLRFPMTSRTNLAFDSPRKGQQKTSLKAKISKNKAEANKNKINSSSGSAYAKYPECYFVERPLSVNEVENVWRSVTLSKLESLLSSTKPEDLLDFKNLSGKTIMHNANKVSRTGVVTLVDRADDIPHWVISAMKCLANWPDARGTGSCLPKYPGFENDVFKVIKNHFLNPQVALISRDIQRFIITAFFRFTYPINWVQMNDNFWSSENIENNDVSSCHKTSTPLSQSKVLSQHNRTDTLLIRSSAGQILLNDSRAIWENPLSICYETEFTSASPVTRVVPNYEESSNVKGSVLSLAESATSARSSSTMSVCTYSNKSYPNMHSIREFSDQDPPETSLNSTQNDSVLEQTVLSLPEDFSSYCTTTDGDGCYDVSFNDNSTLDIETSGSLYISCQPEEDVNHLNDVKDSSEQMCSPYKLNTSCTSQISTSACNQKLFSEDERCSGFEADESSMETKPNANISIKNDSFTAQSNEVVDAYSKQQETEETPNTDALKEVIQTVLLIMPTPQRRHLHLLLRMMNKISRNEKLILNSNMENKEYLLETFMPAVMSCKTHEHQKNVVKEIFSLLVNECESLFKPPSAIKDEAFNRLAELRRRKIKYSVDDLCNLTYCEMISQQQYEQQKVSVSNQALLELLENIISDDKLSDKEKRRRFKQFKESHPDVYKKRFPNPQAVENVFMKPRKQLMTKILSLRM